MGKGGRTENKTVTSAKNNSGVLSLGTNNGTALSGVTIDKSNVSITDGGAISGMQAVASDSLKAAKDAMNSVMSNTGKILVDSIHNNNDVATKALSVSKDSLAKSLDYSSRNMDKTLGLMNNVMGNNQTLVSNVLQGNQTMTRNALANSAGATQSALSIIKNVAENKTANGAVEIADVVKVGLVALAVAIALRGK